jgi:dihydrofolate reductase
VAGTERPGKALRAMIAAVSPEGVIGAGGRIPWHYSADLKRFKRVTRGKTVIMGRRTYESLGGRPLPDRRNIVITRRRYPGVETYPTLEDALLECAEDDVWFIGGAEIYRAAMPYADLIDLTYVPDHVSAPDLVYFPEINLGQWRAGPRLQHEDDARLQRQEFRRRAGGSGEPQSG